MRPTVRYAITTARSRPAALATIDLVSDDPAALERLLTECVGDAPSVGSTPLRKLAGIDEGLVLRVALGHAVLMPHGGPAVQAKLADWLEAQGTSHDPAACAHAASSDPVERAMLGALGRAASPLAVELLLAQPERWLGAQPTIETDRDRRLRRLIDPPTVAAVGAPNVGKSSLLNALVGREAATVRDEPGTTRDHIGARVNLGGLVVCWIDTPGLRRADGPEAEAQRLAADVVAGADLIVRCVDAAARETQPSFDADSTVVVATRCDLAEPAFEPDAAVSAKTGDGLRALVALIRDRLVPAADLADASPWVFDAALLAGDAFP